MGYIQDFEISHVRGPLTHKMFFPFEDDINVVLRPGEVEEKGDHTCGLFFFKC